MRLIRVGPTAVLIETGDPWRSLAVAETIRERGWAIDVVPAAETVLLEGVGALDELERRLARWTVEAAPPSGPEVEIPVVYDGDDLDAVAGQWSVEPAEVVARHTAVEWVALFGGFAPGFAYLATTAEWPEVPRLDSPRARVPAGAVALAGRWSGVYPTASPGGWQLLGSTEVALWDVTREHPALLTPGTRVRFVAQ